MNAEIQKYTSELQERTRRELCRLTIKKMESEKLLEWAQGTVRKLNDEHKCDELIEFINKTYRPMVEKHKILLADMKKCEEKHAAIIAMTFSIPYIDATQANGAPLTREKYAEGLIQEAERSADVPRIKRTIAPITLDPADCDDTKPTCLEPWSVVTMERGNPHGRSLTEVTRKLALVIKRVLIPGTDNLECVVCYFDPNEDDTLIFNVVNEELLLGGPKDANFMERMTE